MLISLSNQAEGLDVDSGEATTISKFTRFLTCPVDSDRAIKRLVHGKQMKKKIQESDADGMIPAFRVPMRCLTIATTFDNLA